MNTQAKIKQVDKYYNALVQLKKELFLNDNFSINKFQRRNKLSGDFSMVLQELGIVRKTGSKNKTKFEYI